MKLMNAPWTATAAHIETALQDGPVDAAPIDWPDDCGAEAVFLGRTRCEDHAQMGPLQHLEYEVYEDMAATVLRDMALDAARRFGCRAVRIVHARGVVKLGDASVVIQVATPHRAESFEACRYLIDRLKHELPVWKRQVWRDGQTFVPGCTAHHETAEEGRDPR